MVWATAQMAFPERELFAASGTASLLVLGQSTPPPAHTTAPNTNQPCGAHHHTRLAAATSALCTLIGRAASFTSQGSQAVLIAQSRVCIRKTRLLPPSHLCFHNRRCSWNPPTLSRTTDLHRSFLPFLETQHLFHHILSSCNKQTAQELGSHCHSHL